MVLVVSIDDASTSIQIDGSRQPDMDAIISRIQRFASSTGVDIVDLDVSGLIPRMIKGISGCERGCPANAKDLVARGYKNYDVQYIEGGILTARAMTREGKTLNIKIFPDF